MIQKSCIFRLNFYKILSLSFCLLAFIFFLCFNFRDSNIIYGKQEAAQPVIVDGDVVEYSAEAKEIIAQGNVVVTYQDTRLLCDRIKVNTQTRDVEASGSVRLEDPRGILEAEKLIYNFETKEGEILEAKLRSSPYYYSGKQAERLSEDEYVVKDGYFSSCNYDRPHFRIKSKRVEIYPDDKIIARSNVVYWSKFPFFYLPRYVHSLKDPFMKVQFQAGKTGDWGPYLLSAWRSDLNDNARLRLYLDYRDKLGLAEGFGVNYDTNKVGRGDFKFYYTQERPKDVAQNLEHEYQRYMVRFRHMWDVDPKTKFTAEYYKIEDDRRARDPDADFLKDYFYREYENDVQPKSYALLSRTLPNSNINMLVQKRTNRWYDKETEKLPEISYDLPNFQIGDTRLYFKNQIKFSNLINKNPPLHLPYDGSPPADAGKDDDVVRFDTYNQFTMPAKFMFLDISPYVGIRETFYSKDNQGGSFSPRTTFYTGMDMSTRFYRVFNINSNFLGLNINRLRHLIIPRVKYSYIHEPTVSPDKLQKFDDIDSINGDNRFTLELENKLQTKRDENPVDLAIFRVSSDYIMYSKKDDISKAQDRFTDFLFDLELTPYAWLRMEADATYDHRNDYFKTVNLDNWLDLGRGRSFGLGHRYQRKGGKEMTSQLIWPINPKWSFRGYWRYQFARTGDYRAGLREQEYTISRDLHCATIDITFNRKKVVEGKTDESVWFVFNLKIFKESEFDYVQSYHPPKQ